MIAKVSPAGVRGPDTVYEPNGRKVATNGAYTHEAPYTASSFETSSQGMTPVREFEPFGGEVPTTPPLNNSPDWIPMGNYQQTGNPLDAQGGCFELGMPTDCAIVAKQLCVDNPVCMNEAGGGIGYVLYGANLRSKSDRAPSGPPILKLAPKRTKTETARLKAIGNSGIYNNEGDANYNPQFVYSLQAFMLLSPECVSAFRNAERRTPAEVIRDRGLVLANSSLLLSEGNNKQLGISNDFRRAALKHRSFMSDGFNYSEGSGPVYTFFNFWSPPNYPFGETSVHESIHGSGVGQHYSAWSYPFPFYGHDLTGYEHYQDILRNCRVPEN